MTHAAARNRASPAPRSAASRRPVRGGLCRQEDGIWTDCPAYRFHPQPRSAAMVTAHHFHRRAAAGRAGLGEELLPHHRDLGRRRRRAFLRRALCAGACAFLGVLAFWIGLCTFGSQYTRNFAAYSFVLSGYTVAIVGIPGALDPTNAFYHQFKEDRNANGGEHRARPPR